jgi:hypothetical protein
MLAAIEAWGSSRGPDRAYWASQGSHLIREWRRLHAIPERAAFQAAVARNLA